MNSTPLINEATSLINAFDDPALCGPRSAYGLGTFGQILNVGGFPRTLQLMVRAAW